MSARVTLSVVEGPAGESEYVYDERAIGLVGRSTDCDIQIPEGVKGASSVSRHHCMIDVNPPNIRIQDFGSLNGTRVNDVIIGRRKPGQSPEEGAKDLGPERDLHHGDRIQLGPTIFEVDISPGDAGSRTYVTAIQCSKCGRSITGGGARHEGNLVCADCQQDLLACVSQMLNAAEDGEPALTGVRGFDIVEELGRGGQGVVFLARDRASQELIALKVLLAQVAATSDAQQRFFREVHSISSLSHPNIVGFRDSGEYGGQFFFTCEYCPGGSVADLVKKRRRSLPVAAAVSIALGVLEGLTYAHNAVVDVPGHGKVKGLVHRDIKPANILLSGGVAGMPTAKLADFGLAKAFDLAGLSGHTLTRSGGGTLNFMSRVQLLNFKYSLPAVDVWSVAASLYWMLAGTPPRDFAQQVNGYKVVLETDPIPLRDRNPEISAALAGVIDTALVDSPAFKIEDARHLAQMLRKAVAE